MSRHPYTNAYDLLRESTAKKREFGQECHISRSDCAIMVNIIGDTIGIDPKKICEALSATFMRSNDEIPPQDNIMCICVVCGCHEKGMIPLNHGNAICPRCAEHLGGVHGS